MPFEQRNFHFLIKNEMSNVLGVFFKVVAMTGKCNIYFSTNNPYPTAQQNDGIIVIDNQHP